MSAGKHSRQEVGEAKGYPHDATVHHETGASASKGSVKAIT